MKFDNVLQTDFSFFSIIRSRLRQRRAAVWPRRSALTPISSKYDGYREARKLSKTDLKYWNLSSMKKYIFVYKMIFEILTRRCSAKTKEGVREVFETATRAALQVRKKTKKPCSLLWIYITQVQSSHRLLRSRFAFLLLFRSVPTRSAIVARPPLQLAKKSTLAVTSIWSALFLPDSQYTHHHFFRCCFFFIAPLASFRVFSSGAFYLALSNGPRFSRNIENIPPLWEFSSPLSVSLFANYVGRQTLDSGRLLFTCVTFCLFEQTGCLAENHSRLDYTWPL